MKVKILIAFILGLSIVLLGAVIEGGHDEVLGEFAEIGVYSPTFSGITPEGVCYLAVTNTITGQTEIFGIPKKALDKITEKPLQLTDQTSVIVELSLR